MSYKITKLSNGLRIITAPLKETKAVTVLVLVKVGSRYETKKLNGVSHFIEHMMFKGTKKRPTTLTLSQELDSVGAEYNAFTGKDHTGYYIKLQSEKIELAMDMLADILFYSLFDPEEINRERRTIIEEINMYEDNPMLYAPAFLEETMFGKTNSLGQLTIGPKENVNKIARPTMILYQEMFYNPSNMVIGVCGNIKKKQVIELVKKYFGSIKKGKEQVFQKTSIIHKSQRVAIKRKDTEQVQLGLGFLGYSYTHKNRYALNLLDVLLGGNMSSRLFIEVRERRGLCYFIHSAANPYQDIGSFIIQAGLNKERASEAIQVIIQELKKVIQEGVDSQELQKAKDYIKGQAILDFEDSHEIAEFYTRQLLLLNTTETLERKIERIEGVTSADIKRTARDVLNIKKSTLVLVGPFSSKKKNHFLRLLRE